MSWQLVYTKHAQKDAAKLAAAGLKTKAMSLLEILRDNPFQNPPGYEKLIGDLAGAYSRRITDQFLVARRILKRVLAQNLQQ